MSENSLQNDSAHQFILIDNIEPHNLAVKERIGRVYKNNGYKIVLVGKYMSFTDYYIPFDAYLDKPSKSYEDYLNQSYQGQNLFDAVQGTIGYKYTEQLCNRRSIKPDCVDELFNEYIRTVDFLTEKLSQFTSCMAVVWCGMFLHSIAFRNVCKKLHIRCFATEFSFDKGRLYFDSKGMIGNRHSFSAADKPSLPQLSNAQLMCIESWIENQKVGKAAQQAPSGVIKNNLFVQDKQNILLICQCRIDTVVTMDNPIFEGSIEAYKAVIELIIAEYPQVNLIVRLHPGDKKEYQVMLIDYINKLQSDQVQISDSGDNVYDVMNQCDKAITINSQAGLEAYVKGKNLLTLGDCFYMGHGFGLRLSDYPDLNQALSALVNSTVTETELLAAKTYLYHYLYQYLVNCTDQNAFEKRLLHCVPKDRSMVDDEVRMIIIHASPRYGGSGYYLQEIAETIAENGGKCMVLSEGSCPPMDNGIEWMRMDWSGPLLTRAIKNRIARFNPNIIYEAGVRTKPMRAALEVYISSRAKFIVQAEDDDFMPYQQKAPNPNMQLLEILDKPNISKKDISSFCKKLDFNFLFSVFANPGKYRWVEPLMRVICYRLADMHSCIWYPMAERLHKRFEKPTFISPPCINFKEYDKTPLRNEEKKTLFSQYGIPDNSYVYFINGTIYSYSEEFKVFLEALVLLHQKTKKRLTLLLAGRIPKKLDDYASAKLKGIAYYRKLKSPDEIIYNQFIKAADVICAPGFNDIFNKYRLCSRLIKAMAFEKPVFTFNAGFGNWLNLHDAGFVTSNDDPVHWAEVLAKSLDRNRCAIVARNGYEFALNHFDSKKIYSDFYSRLVHMLQQPARSISLPDDVDFTLKSQVLVRLGRKMSNYRKQLSIPKLFARKIVPVISKFKNRVSS